MTSIPRFIVGATVVMAALLATGPITSGLADFVLNPGTQATKRALTAPLPSTRGDSDSLNPAENEKTIASTAEVVPEVPARTEEPDTEERVTELAADLQAGVVAGEFTQADADRVLGDMSGYIRGDRTWPERQAA